MVYTQWSKKPIGGLRPLLDDTYNKTRRVNQDIRKRKSQNSGAPTQERGGRKFQDDEEENMQQPCRNTSPDRGRGTRASMRLSLRKKPTVLFVYRSRCDLQICKRALYRKLSNEANENKNKSNNSRSKELNKKGRTILALCFNDIYMLVEMWSLNIDLIHITNSVITIFRERKGMRDMGNINVRN